MNIRKVNWLSANDMGNGEKKLLQTENYYIVKRGTYIEISKGTSEYDAAKRVFIVSEEAIMVKKIGKVRPPPPKYRALLKNEENWVSIQIGG